MAYLVVELGVGLTKQAPQGRVFGVDRRAVAGVDIIADVTTLPFRSGSVDEVWSAHCVEHLTFRQVRQCVEESCRVLRPSGMFRCYLPDVEYWAMECLREGMTERVRDNLYGQQRHPWDVHQSGWTRETLAEELRGVGFFSVLAGQGRTIDELVVVGMKGGH